MKKITAFFLSLCVFNIAHAMQEKNKGKRRPKSIELGSYFLDRNRPKLSWDQAVPGIVAAVDDKTNSLYFSEEWLEHMGKMADTILSLDTLLNSSEQFSDDKFIKRHEQLISQIGPKNDEDEFWLIKS